jgi:hypothetical protein
MKQSSNDEEIPVGIGGKLTRRIQETIIWDEINHEPAQPQEIALTHIVECRADMMFGETLGEKTGIQQTEFSAQAAVDFDDIAELR